LDGERKEGVRWGLGGIVGWGEDGEMRLVWRSLRLVVALAAALVAYPLFLLRAVVQGTARQGGWKREWLKWGSARALRILHVKVESRGPIPPGGLLVSNHQGYLDILCLNVLCPSTFVAKAEIRSWPLFGLFCEWSGTIFLDRKHRTGLRGPLERVVELLRRRERVVIFPEGTDSDGTTVLPFHSSFFEAAIQAQCPVVPLAIRYATPGLGGKQETVGWEDRRFLFHVVRLLGMGEVRARVTLGRPLAAGRDRKRLSQGMRERILTMVSQN
jgi:1-acyl-sn-glycerol-3-phosphate acyltransferase